MNVYFLFFVLTYYPFLLPTTSVPVDFLYKWTWTLSTSEPAKDILQASQLHFLQEHRLSDLQQAGSASTCMPFEILVFCPSSIRLDSAAFVSHTGAQYPYRTISSKPAHRNLTDDLRSLYPFYSMPTLLMLSCWVYMGSELEAYMIYNLSFCAVFLICTTVLSSDGSR